MKLVLQEFVSLDGVSQGPGAPETPGGLSIQVFEPTGTPEFGTYGAEKYCRYAERWINKPETPHETAHAKGQGSDAYARRGRRITRTLGFDHRMMVIMAQSTDEGE